VSELDVMDSAHLRSAKRAAATCLHQRLLGKHNLGLPEIARTFGGEYELNGDERAELLRFLVHRNGTAKK
jgi:hypothetical protein